MPNNVSINSSNLMRCVCVFCSYTCAWGMLLASVRIHIWMLLAPLHSIIVLTCCCLVMEMFSKSPLLILIATYSANHVSGSVDGWLLFHWLSRCDNIHRGKRKKSSNHQRPATNNKRIYSYIRRISELTIALHSYAVVQLGGSGLDLFSVLVVSWHCVLSRSWSVVLLV